MSTTSIQALWQDHYDDARMCRGASKKQAREEANAAIGRWFRGAYRTPRRFLIARATHLWQV